jgi:Spy/CpxP family protein refolding chaperone
VTTIRSTSLWLCLAISGFLFSEQLAFAQPPAAGTPPAAAAGQGGGRGRGGGLPGATPEQTQAVVDMNAALAEQIAAVTSARNALATATFAEVKNVAAITAAVETLRAAELALASKRAEAFARLQAGPNKLNPEQVKALIAAGGNAGRGRGGRGGGI